jgi:hypothetical protein
MSKNAQDCAQFVDPQGLKLEIRKEPCLVGTDVEPFIKLKNQDADLLTTHTVRSTARIVTSSQYTLVN